MIKSLWEIILQPENSLFIEFPDLIGSLGALIVLIAYFLLQSNKLRPTHLAYPILNLVSAVMILFSLAHAWNLAAVITEVAWVMISAFGVVKWLIAFTLKARKKKDVIAEILD